MLGVFCDGCDGSGIRFPATPSCVFKIPPEYTVVERCDHCERFLDDLHAAHQIDKLAHWVQCTTGGVHAIISNASS